MILITGNDDRHKNWTQKRKMNLDVGVRLLLGSILGVAEANVEVFRG